MRTNCSGGNREDCRPINTELDSNIKRIGVTLTSVNNRSIESSKRTSNLNEYRNWMKDNKTDRKDQYCWYCHKNGVNYSCKTCPRSYHKTCASMNGSQSEPQESCPECMAIMRSEEVTDTSLNTTTVHKLTQLLRYTIMTIKSADRNESFLKPVSTEYYPRYLEYIVNPMDLSLVERNVKNKTYASTTSFLADIKWIYHNCFVFNSGINGDIISEAQNVIRIAEQECKEIDICPDCCLNFYTLREETYFTGACDPPHAIVWAKLRGHPYWPAKVVRYNRSRNEVDVRFFGTHDKCWLKPENCFLMSRHYPNNNRLLKFNPDRLDEAIRDLNLHLKALKTKFKKSFHFYRKHTVFTVDKLYLSYDQMSIPSKDDSEDNVTIEDRRSNKNKIIKNQIPKQESRKRVLNSNDDIPLKRLKVKIKADIKFDISLHFVNDSQMKTMNGKQCPENNMSKAIVDTRGVSTQKQLETTEEITQKSSERETTENSHQLSVEEVLETHSVRIEYDINDYQSNDQIIVELIERLVYDVSEERSHSSEVPINQNNRTEPFVEEVAKNELIVESIDCKFFQMFDNSVKIEFEPKLEYFKDEPNPSQGSSYSTKYSNNTSFKPIGSVVRSGEGPIPLRLSVENDITLRTEEIIETISDESDDSVIEINDNSDIVCDSVSLNVIPSDPSIERSGVRFDGNYVQSDPPIDSNKKYVCEQLCGQTSKQRVIFRNRKELNSSIRYRCQWKGCSSSFKKMRYFKSNSIGNDCEVCPIKELQYLCDCVLIDSEPRPQLFKCQINGCNEEFKQRSIRRCHQLSAHPQSFDDQWIQCSENDCDFKTKSKIIYLKHKNEHNFPFMC